MRKSVVRALLLLALSLALEACSSSAKSGGHGCGDVCYVINVVAGR
ncbi:MAG: hypothetical protein LKK13_03315 [Bacilli bacterium]|jgi:ABC-type oligopeptide transport system substrate-binding subunit|nr:hypothetical protein [Bacilli bacterium]